MAILVDIDILEAIGSGKLKVEPFTPGLVQPGSLDIRMGPEVVEFMDTRGLDIKKRELSARTRTIRVGEEGYLVRPQRLVLINTLEAIKLPDDMIGWIEGKSSFAKMGLMVHISSGFIQPGTEGKQTLEVYNVNSDPIRIYPNLPICQVIFEETTSRASRKQGKTGI